MTLGTGGLVAPVGGLIMAHGMDHFFTGLQTAFSGNPRDNVTTQLIQKTGMPAQTALPASLRSIKEERQSGDILRCRCGDLRSFQKHEQQGAQKADE